MNEEILGGLKSALERGESMNKAMMTFYNAGYKKEEIEEAARFLAQNQVAVQPQPSQTSLPKAGLIPKPGQIPVPVPAIPPQINQQVVSGYGNQPSKQPQVKQPVSEYGKKKSGDKVLITILIVVLVLLFGILGAIFLFKDQIINFFSSMFG